MRIDIAVFVMAVCAVVAVTSGFAASAGPRDEGSTDDQKLGASTLPKVLSFETKTLDGKPKKLKDYRGKALLIVNVASRCGLTPQYRDLQELHERYAKKGLAILAFPCNQFGGQEPGTPTEIASFCEENYGVEFELFEKLNVNGEDRHPLYEYLTKLETKPQKKGDIQWNFEKFVVDREGNVIARFHPRVKPKDRPMIRAIEKALGTETEETGVERGE